MTERLEQAYHRYAEYQIQVPLTSLYARADRYAVVVMAYPVDSTWRRWKNAVESGLYRHIRRMQRKFGVLVEDYVPLPPAIQQLADEDGTGVHHLEARAWADSIAAYFNALGFAVVVTLESSECGVIHVHVTHPEAAPTHPAGTGARRVRSLKKWACYLSKNASAKANQVRAKAGGYALSQDRAYRRAIAGAEYRLAEVLGYKPQFNYTKVYWPTSQQANVLQRARLNFIERVRKCLQRRERIRAQKQQEFRQLFLERIDHELRKCAVEAEQLGLVVTWPDDFALS